MTGRIVHGRQKRRDDGMAQRRKVLGDAWVDKSITQPQRLQYRFPGPDHALCLGRDLDPAAFRRAHAPRARDRHHGRARPVGRIPPARARGARRGRFHARRHQGNPAAAGDLLRRAGGQPRRQGSLSDRGRSWAAQAIGLRTTRAARDIDFGEPLTAGTFDQQHDRGAEQHQQFGRVHRRAALADLRAAMRAKLIRLPTRARCERLRGARAPPLLRIADG